MDIETIQNEIYQFNTIFFNDITDMIEKQFEFINDNNLIIPKANYLILKDYLYSTINSLKILDFRFEIKTLAKLQHDIDTLYNLYYNIILYDIEDIFEDKFMNYSPLLLSLIEKIDTLQNTKKISPDEFELRIKMTLNLRKLKIIYYEQFEYIFKDEVKYLTRDILKILNSKLYYIDKLIWVEALKSKTIKKHFENIHISDDVTSKNYLIYTISKIRTNSKKYPYFQSCLRVYK